MIVKGERGEKRINKHPIVCYECGSGWNLDIPKDE